MKQWLNKIPLPIRFTLMTLLCFVGLRFLLGSYIVLGPSMEPSFHMGDRILVEKVSPSIDGLDRGDVVVLRPTKSSTTYLKRIVAVPGDAVEIRDSVVCINGYELADAFMYVPDSEKPDLVPENCYFVLGDNRGASQDSRTWQKKYIHQDDVIGVPILKLPPFFRKTDFGPKPTTAIQETAQKRSDRQAP